LAYVARQDIDSAMQAKGFQKMEESANPDLILTETANEIRIFNPELLIPNPCLFWPTISPQHAIIDIEGESKVSCNSFRIFHGSIVIML